MLKFYNYDIVFQEIPDEVTLALNITNCPNHCQGCHSPHLWEDVGTPLTPESLDLLVRGYDGLITCVCLMGGDAEPELVDRFAVYLRTNFPLLKTAWYTGRQQIASAIDTNHFDYIKVGPYVAELGGLKSPTTNQRLYHFVPGKEPEDMTYLFQKR